MKFAKLTSCRLAAHKARMKRSISGLAGVMLMAGTMLVSGCVTVNAPEDAIVIELNLNIRQEVIYRLAGDVRENIDENPDIF
jgi:hypothetical protein